jgi:hypothetical protein
MGCESGARWISAKKNVLKVFVVEHARQAALIVRDLLLARQHF